MWDTSDDYLRVFEYLESSRNFFYRNYSTPDQPPSGSDREVLRENLRQQIAPVEVVIALTGLYERNQDLLTFQLLYAQASHKPVVVMKPFGSQKPIPKAIASRVVHLFGDLSRTQAVNTRQKSQKGIVPLYLAEAAEA